MPLVVVSPSLGTTLVYDGATLEALTQAHNGLSGRDGVLRPHTVSSESLRGLSAKGIAWSLRHEIDQAETPGFTSHVVAIDEVGNEYRDPRARTRYKVVEVHGRRYRIASHNRVARSPNGKWRVVRTTPTPEPPGPAHPGSRLSEALAILERTPAPWGGSYAARVHLLIAPAMVTSIGVGRGEHFTLDRTHSRIVRPAWRGVMPALARAGGVWLQMYHGDRRPLSARQWRLAPGRIADYVARTGGRRSRVHLLFTKVAHPPAGTGGCASPMTCQWQLARTGPTRSILANGAGAYRLEEAAGDWLRGYRISGAS